MAYAVIGGLAVVTVLTLVVFLPSLYVAWFRVKAARLRVWTGSVI